MAAITDINIDGVLGLDLMSRNNCTINVSEQRMIIEEEIIRLLKRGYYKSYRLQLLKT